MGEKMDLLNTFLYIKDEPIAMFVFIMLIIYKILSLIIIFVKERYFSKPNKDLQLLLKDISILKIHDDKLSTEDRMESLYDYLYAGFNGETLSYGTKELILPNPKVWDSIYRKKIVRNEDFNPKKNFEQAMQRINQYIYDKRQI